MLLILLRVIFLTFIYEILFKKKRVTNSIQKTENSLLSENNCPLYEFAFFFTSPLFLEIFWQIDKYKDMISANRKLSKRVAVALFLRQLKR